MRSRGFKFALLGLAFGGLAAAVALVKLDNARLRKRVADAQRQQGHVLRLRAENERMRTLVAQAKTDESAAAAAVHAQVLQLRAEIGRVEKGAREIHALVQQKTTQDAAMLEHNRDLRRGLVRLEHFSDVGRATPEAALQTLVSAAFKGEDAQLASVLGLSESAREKAHALLAALPAEAHATWTAEKLAALFFTGFFSEISAATIQDVTLTDPTHAVIAFRVTNGSKEITLPLGVEAAGDGWRVMLPEKAMGAVQRRLQAMEKNVPAN